MCEKLPPSSIKYKQNYKKCFTLTRELTQDVVELISATGLPYIEAQGEADSQAAAIAIIDDDISGIISNDTDTVLYGAPVMFKDFSFKEDKPANPRMVKQISLERLLNNLTKHANEILLKNDKSPIIEFTYESLVDLCILKGTDYGYGYTFRGLTFNKLFESFVLNNFDVKQLFSHFKSNKQSIRKKDLSKEKEKSTSSDSENSMTLDEVYDDFYTDWIRIKQHYMEVKVANPLKMDKKLKKPNREKLLEILCKKFELREKDVIDDIRDLEQFYDNQVKRDETTYKSTSDDSSSCDSESEISEPEVVVKNKINFDVFSNFRRKTDNKQPIEPIEPIKTFLSNKHRNYLNKRKHYNKRSNLKQ